MGSLDARLKKLETAAQGHQGPAALLVLSEFNTPGTFTDKDGRQYSRAEVYQLAQTHVLVVCTYDPEPPPNSIGFLGGDVDPFAL